MAEQGKDWADIVDEDTAENKDQETDKKSDNEKNQKDEEKAKKDRKKSTEPKKMSKPELVDKVDKLTLENKDLTDVKAKMKQEIDRLNALVKKVADGKTAMQKDMQKEIDRLNAEVKGSAQSKSTLENDMRSEIDQLKVELKSSQDDRSDTLDELAVVYTQLDEQKKITEDLLLQLDIDDPSSDENKKMVMLLIDNTPESLEPYLDTKYNWTICTTLKKVQDITAILQDENHREEIMAHDKVVISAGLRNIEDGENGKQVATAILRAAEQTVDMTGIEVTIICLTPTKVKQAQILLCNSRLEKMPQRDGISVLKIEQLLKVDKNKIMKDDYRLNTEGTQILATNISDKLEVSGEKMTPKPVKALVKELKPTQPRQQDVDQNESESESDELEIKEIMKVTKPEIGKLIGEGGYRIKQLQAKTDTAIHIDEVEENGIPFGWVHIRGRVSNVHKVKMEILRVIQPKRKPEKKPKTPSGVSPIPKKPKKGGRK